MLAGYCATAYGILQFCQKRATVNVKSDSETGCPNMRASTLGGGLDGFVGKARDDGGLYVLNRVLV